MNRLGFGIAVIATVAWQGYARGAGIDSLKVPYTTTGTIGSEGVTGAPALRFVGWEGALYDRSSGGIIAGIDPATSPRGATWTFVFGRLQTSLPTGGGTTTYRDTPIDIDIRLANADPAVISLTGTINGTVDAVHGSNINLDFQKSVDLSNDRIEFYFTSSNEFQRLLIPYTVENSPTKLPLGQDIGLIGFASTAYVPEPSSGLILLSLAAVVAASRLQKRLR